MTQTTLSQLGTLSLDELLQSEAFSKRHLGPDENEQALMLQTLGFNSLAALIDKVVPESIRRQDDMVIG